MGLWDRVTSMMALAPWDHPPVELSAPSAEQQLARVQRQAAPRPWRPATISEALGVPAVYGAVTLIGNVASSLTLRAYHDGEPVPDGDRPSLVVRPNPFSTPRSFVQETTADMAVRGEGWWWVAARDSDGHALSLVPVPANEVRVRDRRGDWLRPVIEWRGREMDNRDMVQVPLWKRPGSLRGEGPLQACGAAISVAVEAQEWAANFFADGGHPSIVLRTDLDLSPDESRDLREQWVETPPNMPQVISGGLAADELGANVPAAQMLEARNRTAGDVAQMFHVPGSLLEYERGGSSLTYQNVSAEFDKFLRSCLLPDYLEPIEQAMSDLLPRAWSVRFNVDALLRADVKTRFEVYGIGIDKGILTVEQAMAREGLARGDVEAAPVPPSPPSAVPAGLPVGMGMTDRRCRQCKRLLGRAEGASELPCKWCKTVQLDVAA